MKKHWIEYVFNQFERIYGFSDWDKVTYGENSSEAKVFIVKEESGFFNASDAQPSNELWANWKETKIPVFFHKEMDSSIISQKEEKVIVNIDVIANSFYFLSGWQEYFSTSRDNIGRFKYEGSVQDRLGIVTLPIVNYYFDILKTALEKGLGIKLSCDLWDGKNNAVFLSHDIDKVNGAWLEDSFSELKKKRLKSAVKLLLKKGIGRDAWFNLQEIADLEKEHGANSTFYFLTEKGKCQGVLNSDYEINHPLIKQEILSLKEQGFDIGIHGSYGSAFEAGKLNQEINKLPVKVSSNRFHFLSWDPCETPGILENSSLKTDSSLGFSEHYGFRNGICHPFNIFDLKNDKACGILEYPLHLMDTTFQQTKYLNKNKTEILNVFKELNREAKKFQGFVSVLWHNNFFSPYKYEGWREVYLDILKEASSVDSRFIVQ